MNWKKPKAVAFDYGRTLVIEPDHNRLRGIHHLLEAVSNRGCSVPSDEAYLQARTELVASLSALNDMSIDFSEIKLMRLLFARFGIQTDMADAELETILWNGISSGRPTDCMAETLQELNRRGIAVAVISNAEYSAEAMKLRLKRLFPMVKFDAVITSCDYMFRKPTPLLFKGIAAHLHLRPEQIWFCGDDPHADMFGAHSVGMHGILYRKYAKKDQLIPVSLPEGCLEIPEISALLEIIS